MHPKIYSAFQPSRTWEDHSSCFPVSLTLILQIFCCRYHTGSWERKGVAASASIHTTADDSRKNRKYMDKPSCYPNSALIPPSHRAWKENWIFSKARQVAGKYFLVNYLRMLGKVCCYLMSALRCLTLVIKLISTGTSTHQSKLGIRDILRRQSIKQHRIKSLGNQDGTCSTWKIRQILPKKGQLACWKSILTTRNVFLALRVTVGASVQACS